MHPPPIAKIEKIDGSVRRLRVASISGKENCLSLLIGSSQSQQNKLHLKCKLGSLQVQYSPEVLDNTLTLLVAMKEQPVFRDFAFTSQSKTSSGGTTIEKLLRRFAKGAKTKDEV